MTPHAAHETALAQAPPSDQAQVLSEELSGAMAEMFRALADASRAKIVHALTHQDMTTSGLAACLGMSAPSVSQHLRLLRMLRIVRPRREGRLVFYSLDDAHIRLLVSLSITHLSETHAHSHFAHDEGAEPVDETREDG
jgi:DNA-binding transcriptional ArsR family regulator